MSAPAAIATPIPTSAAMTARRKMSRAEASKVSNGSAATYVQSVWINGIASA